MSDDESANKSKKSNFLALRDKAAILEHLERGVSASQLAREFNVSKSTISRFKAHRENIKNAITVFPNNSDRRTMRGSSNLKMETALYQWYLEQRKRSVDVTSSMMRDKAKSFHRELSDNDNFCASSSWLTKFRRRYGIQWDTKTKKKQRFSNKNVTTNGLSVEKRLSIPTGILSNRIDTKEAVRSVDILVRWCTENSVDPLYLTMLKNLKTQIRSGPKVKYIRK